jgi:hypothetical protein
LNSYGAYTYAQEEYISIHANGGQIRLAHHGATTPPGTSTAPLY